jgi:hypothetical protein
MLVSVRKCHIRNHVSNLDILGFIRDYKISTKELPHKKIKADRCKLAE